MSDIHSETYGQGETIVLVHGWAMHSGIWRDFAKELAKKYRVILLDLPGHGLSEPISPFTLATVAKSLTELVVEDKCCWLGWSLGAEFVLEIARSYPQKVNKLILLTGSPCFMRKENWPGMAEEVLNSFAENLRQDTQTTLFRFLSLQIKGENNQKATLQQLKALVAEVAAPNLQTLEEGLTVLKQSDLRQDFPRLTMPVAAIFGELDTLVPVNVAERMQHLLPGLQLTIIKRAGHVPFLTHQTDVVQAVRQFMESHVSG